jgi:hypothetical protein
MHEMAKMRRKLILKGKVLFTRRCSNDKAIHAPSAPQTGPQTQCWRGL